MSSQSWRTHNLIKIMNFQNSFLEVPWFFVILMEPMQLITKYIIVEGVVVPFQVHAMVCFVSFIHPWLVLPIHYSKHDMFQIIRAWLKLFLKLHKPLQLYYNYSCKSNHLNMKSMLIIHIIHTLITFDYNHYNSTISICKAYTSYIYTFISNYTHKHTHINTHYVQAHTHIIAFHRNPITIIKNTTNYPPPLPPSLFSSISKILKQLYNCL